MTNVHKAREMAPAPDFKMTSRAGLARIAILDAWPNAYNSSASASGLAFLDAVLGVASRSDGRAATILEQEARRGGAFSESDTGPDAESAPVSGLCLREAHCWIGEEIGAPEDGDAEFDLVFCLHPVMGDRAAALANTADRIFYARPRVDSAGDLAAAETLGAALRSDATPVSRGAALLAIDALGGDVAARRAALISGFLDQKRECALARVIAEETRLIEIHIGKSAGEVFRDAVAALSGAERAIWPGAEALSIMAARNLSGLLRAEWREGALGSWIDAMAGRFGAAPRLAEWYIRDMERVAAELTRRDRARAAGLLTWPEVLAKTCDQQPFAAKIDAAGAARAALWRNWEAASR